MPELTNLLRQRLAGTENGALVHPDADTITAYVEQSLSTAERQTMAAHLAGCEPCREVVALSLPQLHESAIQTVLKPAPVSAWRRLFTPAFGLAASVTAMAIIAVLVLQLPHRAGPLPAQENQQAQSTVPAEPVADGAVAGNKDAATQSAGTKPGYPTTPESANTLDRAQLAQIETQSRQRRDESARMQIAAGFTEPAAPLKAPILTAGLLKKDYVNTNFFANSDDNVVLEQQSNAGRSGNIPVAPQPQAATANRSFGYASDRLTNFSDIPANAAGKSTVHILTPSPSPERFTCTLCKVAQATAQATAHTLHLRTVTPALHASALGNSALGGPGMFSNTLEKNQSTEVSAALDKDEGGSLANSGVLSHGALGISSYKSSANSEPTQWKVAGGKLIKADGQSQWEDAYPAAGIEFASVNARGKDVWAGGSHAFLLHSRDAGVTWEVVKLGDTANGTIVGIIAGAFNVQVKTSENQLWLSADGGKTWTLSSE
jgi:Photosynthesis system II assembly factor YCF48/Putative zinc-finger